MRDGTAPLDLIVQSASFFTAWQVVPGEAALYFVRLGMDQDLSSRTFDGRVLPSGDDASIRLQMKGRKGFSIPWEDIEAVRLRFQAVGSKPNDDTFGTLTIRTRDKRRRFHLIRLGMLPGDVIAFFAPVADRVSADLRRYEREEAEMACEKAMEDRRAQRRDPLRTKRLKALRIALLVLPLTLLPVTLLSNSEALRNALAAAISLLPILLCAALPDWFPIAPVFALRRQRWLDRPETPSMVNVILIDSAISFALGLWSATVLDRARLTVICIVCGIVLALLMTRCEKVRRIWRIRAVLALGLSACMVGNVLILNRLLDRREPTVSEATIADMQIHGAGRSATYKLYFDTLPIPVDVTRPEYEALEQGDTVVLVEHPGAFGIRCVEAWLPEEWNAAE